MSSTAPRRGIGDLISSIAQNAADLASAEVRMARDEAIDTGKDSLNGGILTLLAGVVAIPVMIFAGLALSAALLEALGPVGAHLVTALVFAVIAGILYAIGRSKIGTDEPLNRTREQLRRDQRVVKENVQS